MRNAFFINDLQIIINNTFERDFSYEKSEIKGKENDIAAQVRAAMILKYFNFFPE